MKYLEPILVFTLIIGIGVFVYVKEVQQPIVPGVKEVIKLKDKLVVVHDTITNLEVRIKKAKAIHDTVTILKEQDTLIKVLKVEVKLQDTIIGKQDTIIIDCNKELKKEKFKKKGAFLLGAGLGFAAGYVIGRIR